MTEIITRTESGTEYIHSQDDFKGCDFVTLIVPTDFTRRRFYHFHCSSHCFIQTAGRFLPAQLRKMYLHRGYQKNYRWTTLKIFRIGFAIHLGREVHSAQTSRTYISNSCWGWKAIGAWVLSTEPSMQSPQQRLSLYMVTHFGRWNTQQRFVLGFLADSRFDWAAHVASLVWELWDSEFKWR